MEGLLSFLIFAVFFYLMMRFGCGAHMMHGHHGNSKKTSKPDPVFDPVCGMKIGEEEGYGKLHDGVLFRFCSRKCLDEFDQNPEKYISQSISKSLEEHNHDS